MQYGKIIACSSLTSTSRNAESCEILLLDCLLLLFTPQALHVAAEVAGTSVSTSPLPYGAMASQCDALGTGTRKKLSTWLVDSHDPVPDAHPLTLPVSCQSGIVKVIKYNCISNLSTLML